jgi:glycosyltransferase involved in cell wall biosynthesis
VATSRGNDEQIDTSVATKNSARTITRCIKAILENIPVRRLIVVDGGSTDDTVAIARSLGADVIVNRGLLGSVRYSQAQQCSSEWVAIIDSDVYVYPAWWPEVSRYREPDVGMILAIGDSPTDRLPIYEEYMKHMASRFGSIAFSNTLVRRELILSCSELLNNIHAGEDTVFGRYLGRIGMRIVTVQKRLVYHDKNVVNEHPGAFLRWGQSLRTRGGRDGARELAKTLKNNVRNWLLFTKDTHRLNIRLLVFLLYLWFWTFTGYVGIAKPTAAKAFVGQEI